jgi:alkylation response protein AidB-like acyl-CoA dehydrogenase
MDFEPSDEQGAICEAAEQLLATHAGPARAAALDASDAYDHELDAALSAAGFTEAALGPETGFLEAVLLLRAVSRAAGCVAFGAAALVAPGVAGRTLPGPVALARVGDPAPVRFAAHAKTLLLDAGDEARVVRLEPGAATPVRTNYLWPMGRVHAAPGAGTSLGPGSGARLRRWWRLCLATELLGHMESALDITVAYVRGRRQFGRAIGSFQAVQHLLAEAHCLTEGAFSAALYPAWAVDELGPDEARSAGRVAKAYCARAARTVCETAVQVHGGMGNTWDCIVHVYLRRALLSSRWFGDDAEHLRQLQRTRLGATHGLS